MAGNVHLASDAGVATLTFDTPGKLNAINVAMWNELQRIVTALAADDGVQCVVVRGAGGNFAAGADLAEFDRLHADPENGRRFHLDVVLPALDAVRELPQPVVAAIEGVCAGGGLQVALACDIRLAAANARFGVPVGRLGFPVVLPELRLLLDRLGQTLTAELLLTGRLLDASEAQQRGVVSRVAAAAEFESLVTATVRSILAGSPLAARRNKAQIRQLVERRDYTVHELDASFDFLQGEDHHEGLAAFIAKRLPIFKSK